MRNPRPNKGTPSTQTLKDDVCCGRNGDRGTKVLFDMCRFTDPHHQQTNAANSSPAFQFHPNV